MSKQIAPIGPAAPVLTPAQREWLHSFTASAHRVIGKQTPGSITLSCLASLTLTALQDFEDPAAAFAVFCRSVAAILAEARPGAGS